MKKQSFEESMTQLESIVETLESGHPTLDEALKNYEEGIKLSRTCASFLKKAETKVIKLTKDLDGQLKEEPFLLADDE